MFKNYKRISVLKIFSGYGFFLPIPIFIAKIFGLMSRDRMRANCYISCFRSRCSLDNPIRRLQFLYLLGLASFTNLLLATNPQRYFSLTLKAMSFSTLMRKETQCLHIQNVYKEVYLRLHFMFTNCFTSK